MFRLVSATAIIFLVTTAMVRANDLECEAVDALGQPCLVPTETSDVNGTFFKLHNRCPFMISVSWRDKNGDEGDTVGAHQTGSDYAPSGTKFFGTPIGEGSQYCRQGKAREENPSGTNNPSSQPASSKPAAASPSQDTAFCDQFRDYDQQIRCGVDCKKDINTCDQWKKLLSSENAQPKQNEAQSKHVKWQKCHSLILAAGVCIKRCFAYPQPSCEPGTPQAIQRCGAENDKNIQAAEACVKSRCGETTYPVRGACYECGGRRSLPYAENLCE
jgi:hypothetical protein